MFGAKRRLCRVYFLAWVLLLGYSVDSEAQSLHEIEDKLAIAEQLASYSYRWDTKDAEGFSDLFTDNGVMERWQTDELVKASRVTGRQAIFNYAKRSYEGRLAGRQSRHHFYPSKVDFLCQRGIADTEDGTKILGGVPKVFCCLSIWGNG